jgi:phosphatidate cytidylyltransferase
LLLIAFIPWFNDTFAYFIGRAMGKRLLAPKISPKKTVEGAIGGIIITVVAYVGVMFIWQQPSNMQILLHAIVAFALSLVSILGDLFQSKLKRLVNAKDSSQLLPGHGGFFDRFDAMIGVILMNVFLLSFYY